ncbi:hypothetical protein ACFQ48_13370 [Hymenobacter caeli]|uniref:Uncharacterized protein n=1 Tax=Hymenobacter caeli TaxID=2735894 RepID=A0ABX2FT76_9BACT|nr:hypothetical protein [Hymenobacter caeli]NRT20393.1 hypothetical protein [Hymenobacter caeli]
MPAHAISPPRLSQLVWHHYRWHLWVGLLIWASAVMPFAFIDCVKKKSLITASAYYANNHADAITSLACDQLETAVILLLLGLASAAVCGLIRHYYLFSISCKALTPNELVYKSLLAYEIPLVLMALVPWPVAYNRFSLSMVGHQLIIYLLFSLPWLLATGLASRRLATALFLPHSTK